MPIEIVERYTREEIQANPEKLYVFGDNFQRVGYGGQAAEARDEPNAVGIATKIDPGRVLTDEYFAEVVLREFVPKFMLLKTWLETGGTVVWPKDGIGTGLAMLPTAAPKIFAKFLQLQEWLGVHSKTQTDGESVPSDTDGTSKRRHSFGTGA